MRATRASRGRSPRTRAWWDKVAAMGQGFGFLASAADEGRNIILSMLVVGLIFLVVIALGDINDWFARRRHHRRARRRVY